MTDDDSCSHSDLALEIERFVDMEDGKMAESLMGDNIPLICAALRAHDDRPSSRALTLAMWRLIGACDSTIVAETVAYKLALALLEKGPKNP